MARAKSTKALVESKNAEGKTTYTVKSFFNTEANKADINTHLNIDFEGIDTESLYFLAASTLIICFQAVLRNYTETNIAEKNKLRDMARNSTAEKPLVMNWRNVQYPLGIPVKTTNKIDMTREFAKFYKMVFEEDAELLKRPTIESVIMAAGRHCLAKGKKLTVENVKASLQGTDINGVEVNEELLKNLRKAIIG